VSRTAVFDYYDEAGLGVELIQGTAAGGKSRQPQEGGGLKGRRDLLLRVARDRDRGVL